ncbi:unnamed protein product [Arctogadus glacialis]
MGSKCAPETTPELGARGEIAKMRERYYTHYASRMGTSAKKTFPGALPSGANVLPQSRESLHSTGKHFHRRQHADGTIKTCSRPRVHLFCILVFMDCAAELVEDLHSAHTRASPAVETLEGLHAEPGVG